jgi:Spy/CpxP family protein refolding chaperone
MELQMRNMSKWLAIGVLLATGGTALIADNTPATPSAAPAPTTKPAHLIKPYSELPDLTDDEKTQLVDIHEKAEGEVRAIHEKERADLLAVLTDDQKKELADIEAQDRVAAAEKAAKHHHSEATTKPAE